MRVTADVPTLTRALPLALAVALTATVLSAGMMPVSEVTKGMKGYGLTVFEGDQIEKFDVEIVGVLHRIGPGQDLILARVDSPQIRRAGVIAGMSGSPIFIDGKIIGALAYAWDFSKEPVAGITPIHEMLKIAEADGGSSPALVAAAPRMSAQSFLESMANQNHEKAFEELLRGLTARQVSTIGGARRIALPLSLGSFAPETLVRFGSYFDQMGFVAVPTGSSATAGSGARAARSAFAPGDAVGAALLNGDFSAAASGTVTWVDGDRVYAFGHPFLDMGEISFPMTEAEVVGFMPSVARSFKFSNSGRVVGALTQDRAPGIMGVFGAEAPMIPVELTVEGAGTPKTYNVNVVRHPQLSPLMIAMAADSVVANSQRAAGERTVVLESEIKLKGFEPIRLREGWAGAQARSAIPAYLAVVSGYLISNEFRDAELESVKVHLRHDDQLRIARIIEATLVTEAGRVSPGDTVRVRAVLKPYRGEAFVETFELRIPDDQAPGSAYLMVGSGTTANQIDFSLVPPNPRTLEHVLGVLARLRPSTDLTVGLYSPADGAVTAGVYLPNLPPTMRAVVTSDTSNAPKLPVRYHGSVRQARSLGYIVEGALKIDLKIRPNL
ncbi:MAG TPA: SpoIVB peptidase S55 domain-containing protein [Thermoanaerobaculia bacterium]|nr:SpoIVB peptidase S55 domain-containing protein [Thermoanaerobaculia bacterium]